VRPVGTALQIIGDSSLPTERTSRSTAKVIYSERRYGGFKRLVNLPGAVRIDGKITASAQRRRSDRHDAKATGRGLGLLRHPDPHAR